jgi:hypothetical protein
MAITQFGYTGCTSLRDTEHNVLIKKVRANEAEVLLTYAATKTRRMNSVTG